MRGKVIVIGAGMGGMAAAIRLARSGFAVEIWEKNDEAGGKLQEVNIDGFRWDAGPSLLTMPQVLRELFADAGFALEDFLRLERLPSACRYFWSDGTVIDEDEAFWARPETARFLRHAKGIFDLSGEAFLHHPPSDFWRAFTLRNLGKLRHLPKVATFETLAGLVERSFSDPHLRQLFNRFATYNGSSPYETPATFAIIPYVEATYGAWHVAGGMARLRDAVRLLAERVGVVFRFKTTAVHFDGTTLTADDGRTGRADYFICNGDVIQASSGFLRDVVSPRDRGRLQSRPMSCSGWILFLGVKKRYPQLGHHNIFFSNDYASEFDALFREKRLADEPTIYISITARADPSHAPPGHDNYFVLVNAPGRPADEPMSESENRAYRDRVVARLEAMGLAGLEGEIVAEKSFGPSDFARRDLSWNGTLYGWASHSISTALFRPSMRLAGHPNFYFVGGTTHPGGGIPLVLLSGKMAARSIERSAR